MADEIYKTGSRIHARLSRLWLERFSSEEAAFARFLIRSCRRSHNGNTDADSPYFRVRLGHIIVNEEDFKVGPPNISVGETICQAVYAEKIVVEDLKKAEQKHYEKPFAKDEKKPEPKAERIDNDQDWLLKRFDEIIAYLDRGQGTRDVVSNATYKNAGKMLSVGIPKEAILLARACPQRAWHQEVRCPEFREGQEGPAWSGPLCRSFGRGRSSSNACRPDSGGQGISL